MYFSKSLDFLGKKIKKLKFEILEFASHEYNIKNH